MFPSLRIGYLVVPEDLAVPFGNARAALDDHPSSIAQPALAAFIEEGHFASHLRRMRKLYAERREALAEHLDAGFGNGFQIAPSQAGMHLLARLDDALAVGLSDKEIQRRAAERGVTVSALSAYYAQSQEAERGLLLGFSAVPVSSMKTSVERLMKAFEV